MSGSGRKRSSKWDLRDQPPFDEVHPQEDGWSSKSGRSFYHHEASGWQSPEPPGSNGSKWSNLETNDQRSKHDSVLPSRETFSGSRGSHKNDKFDKERNRYGEDSMAWEEDRDYGTRMSPGLVDWRQQNPSQSPKSGWNRSLRDRSRSRSRSRGRSRSPGHSLRRESSFIDRTRSRSGASSQLCKDFTAGRCRRGDHCQFLHDADENYDDYWDNRHMKGGSSKYSALDTREYTSRSGRSSMPCNDFVKGRCRRGTLCKFDHPDEFGKLNEGNREKESERRKRDTSTERVIEHEFRRSSSDIPCKFFSAGNCRNGKHCRFSHHSQAYSSPDRKSQDKLAFGRKSDEGNQVWDGPKWNDKVILSDDAKLSAGIDAKSGGLDPSSTGWSMNDRLRKSVNNESTAIAADPGVNNEATKSNENEALHRKIDGAGASMNVSGSRQSEKWLEDMDMSPDWNFSVPSSSHMVKEEQSHIPRRSDSFKDMSLKTGKQGVAEMASTRFNGTAAIVQPMINTEPFFQPKHDLRDGSATALTYDDKSAVRTGISSRADLNIPINIVSSTQNLDKNGQNASVFPFSSLNTVEQSQTPILNEHRGAIPGNLQNVIPSTDGKSIIQPEFQDTKPSQVNPGISPSPNLVSGEQLKNLSASLVHLLGNGQQLPQLYAALSSNNSIGTPSFAKAEGSAFPVSAATVHPNPATGLHKNYDPMHDSAEPQSDISNNPPGFLPISAVKTSVTDGKPDTQLNLNKSSFPSLADSQAVPRAEESNQKSKPLASVEPNASADVSKERKEPSTRGSGESKKENEENRKADESDILEGGAVKEKATNGKKNKEVKGIRAFKFALVEFVKELLKPSWKDGQINKDAYKTIVKKVVDKVTATMQGANIPQTQEKIDHYLSFSKEKLTKLVQAYVEKNQKV